MAPRPLARAILRSAYRKNVPVYVPAFTDSELGLDFAIHNRKLLARGKTPFAFNPFLDLEDFANREDEGVLLVRKAGEMLYRLED